MVTDCLRRLEQRASSSRTVEATVPVSVSYERSPRGYSFFDAFGALPAWADDDASQEAPRLS